MAVLREYWRPIKESLFLECITAAMLSEPAILE
jgi:hypothetical protein